MSLIQRALLNTKSQLTFNPSRSFALYRKAKVHHMSYNCVPDWMKPAPKDPFDYKLRSKEEVMEEFKYYEEPFPIEA